MEEHGAPAPQLPPPRRDMQGAGVLTPLRRDADGHGGLRAPGTRLPQRGRRVAPQILTEARDQDVGSDRRNVPWSPDNILIDTVARYNEIWRISGLSLASFGRRGPTCCADPSAGYIHDN